MNGLFVERLRNLMRSWHWTEAQVEKNLPKVIQACINTGIMVEENNELVLTSLSKNNEAWERVWSRIKDIEEGGAG